MSVASAYAGEDGRLVHVSPGFCRLLGYSERELLELSLDELARPEQRSEVINALRDAAGNGLAGVCIDLSLIAKEGAAVAVELACCEVADPASGRRLTVIHAQDIGERRRAELALAEERQLLDEFLANIPAQVYFKDRESRFLRVSQAQATKLGFDDASDLIGRTDFDVFGDEHAAKARADEEQVMRTAQPIIDLEEREVYHGRTAGRAREPGWVLTTKLPLRDSTGAIVGTFGISQDITARKRAEAALRDSEERWRALLEHLQEIVVLADPAGRLIYATPSMQRWLGYHPEELIGIDLATTAHPEDVATLTQAFRTAASGQPIRLTHRIRHKDGSWHTLESTVVSLRENPVVEAVLFTSADVTDRIALEEERERLEMERRVSHRLEAVGQLAAGIAHEINTPLQFVGDSIVFLKEAVEELLVLADEYREVLWGDEPISLAQRQQMMREAEERADLDYLMERVPAAFERTADGIQRVRTIVQAMKRFSHPSNGDIEPVNLAEAIETTLTVCRNEYKYVADVELELGELPPVPCNLGEINQVLLNLIVNAAQAIEEGRGQQAADGDELRPGKIRISTAVDHGHAVLRISDNGPGIPKALQERIYEPFFTTKEVGRGTGQGLALARATINRHCGSLECDSAPGHGATFTIRLPLERSGAGADMRQRMPAAVGQNGLSDLAMTNAGHRADSPA
jgi:two-component system NtrC family sensor kinase